MKIPITINRLEEIYDNYDAFILDQWGVIHDGNKGYLNAIKCIKKLYSKKKILTIISNSSRKKEETIMRLPNLGFQPAHFHEVMTSGEMIWLNLKNKNNSEVKNLGKRCFHIYDQTKNEGEIFQKGLEKYIFVKNIEDADFILGCTPFFEKAVVDYIPLLNVAKEKDLLFVCANPDFESLDKKSNSLTFCMGTIAELYNSLGGNTFLLGKPSIEIYKKTFEELKNIKKSRILAIGDSLFHDIKGALNFGVDSLLITSTGIHNNFFDNENPSWKTSNNSLKKLGIKPTYVCKELFF
ncbi:TIGR01459 family HAD-type hydrolase [Alphaproteobacteria bacterium]|nr:TIGR01459 family HAD-type hydrolase [Alphaproteobacteria bacterium]